MCPNLVVFLIKTPSSIHLIVLVRSCYCLVCVWCFIVKTMTSFYYFIWACINFILITWKKLSNTVTFFFFIFHFCLDYHCMVNYTRGRSLIIYRLYAHCTGGNFLRKYVCTQIWRIPYYFHSLHWKHLLFKLLEYFNIVYAPHANHNSRILMS